MNFTNPELFYEINRQKIQRDQAFILKEEMLKPRSVFGVMSNVLGTWMIAKGEQLRKRHIVTQRKRNPVMLQDQASLFKA